MSSRDTLSTKMLGVALLGGVLMAVATVVIACNPSESAQDLEPESTLDVDPILAQCFDQETMGFSVHVDSVKDATALAGFDVHRPSNVDSALVPASEGIGVSGATEPPDHDSCHTSVLQTWQDSDTDGGIWYSQFLTHGMLNYFGGEATLINGTPGERTFRESKLDRPDSLGLGWQQDGVQHRVFAALAGIVTEDSVERFAATVQARK